MKNEEEVTLPMKRVIPEEETRVDLGDNRLVSVSVYRGRSYVDIREFFYIESGELRPTKKGIALKPAEWNQLLEVASRINADVKKTPKEENKIEVGENRFGSVSSYKGRQYVNIREYYTDESGRMRPSNKGISLKPEEWKKLLTAGDSIS
ncbi:MAG: transcriptional coactivator p15/PC4 family protein [Rhodobacteraceae bacterium]|nr:transcriptional coactivator p15/PC4 family protein [Paracoccaceae bacterium]